MWKCQWALSTNGSFAALLKIWPRHGCPGVIEHRIKGHHAPILDCVNYLSLYLLSCKVGAMISTGTEQKFTGVSKLGTRSSLVRSLQHCYLLQHSTPQTCIITRKHLVCHQVEWMEAVLSDGLPSEPNRCHWARPGPSIFWQHLVSCGEAKFAGVLAADATTLHQK